MRNEGSTWPLKCGDPGYNATNCPTTSGHEPPAYGRGNTSGFINPRF
jgi:hypothetical protein